MMGFGAGGRISQKINRDPLPVTAYNQTQFHRLHITIINAAFFPAVTGIPNPPSPIGAHTYITHKFPWFKLYDEHIPTANNTSSPTPLAGIKSVAQMSRERGSGGQTPCVYCHYEMATLFLRPCGHTVCDDCSNSVSCPSCRGRVVDRERFAAPAPMPGNEDEDGGEDTLGDCIVRLRDAAQRGAVVSFERKRDAVSALSGES
jgi:hypothetical protein